MHLLLHALLDRQGQYADIQILQVHLTRAHELRHGDATGQKYLHALGARQFLAVRQERLHVVSIDVLEEVFEFVLDTELLAPIRQQTHVDDAQQVLWPLYLQRAANDDNEILLGARTQLKRDALRQLLRDRVLYEPRLVQAFRVLDVDLLAGAADLLDGSKVERQVTSVRSGSYFSALRNGELGDELVAAVAVRLAVDRKLNDLLASRQILNHQVGAE